MESSIHPSSLKSRDSLIYPEINFILTCNKLPLPCYFKFYQKTNLVRENYVLFAATDTNETDSNITYTRKIKLSYNFALSQYIYIELHQVVVEESFCCASTGFQLVDLLKSPNKVLPLELRYHNNQIYNQQYATSIKVSIDDPKEERDLLTIQFGAEYTKKTLFGINTYFTLWKMDEKNQLVQISQSDIISGKKTLWPPIQLRVSDEFKKNGIFRMVVHNKEHKVVGNSEFTFSDITFRGRRDFKIVKFESDYKSIEKNQIKEKGSITVASWNIKQSINIVDFFVKGMQLDWSLCVDFSGYFELMFDLSYTENFKKEVIDTMKALSKIINPYSTGVIESAYGIGAYTQKSLGDYFMLENSFEPGNLLTNVCNAFETAFTRIQNKQVIRMESLLKAVIKRVREDMILSKTLKYYVFTIFMTGGIADFYEMIDQIVLASHEVPISFIFIGFGDKTFSQLSTIQDQFDELTDSRQRGPKRRNFKFVSLKDFLTTQLTSSMAMEDLTRDIWGYIEMTKVKPGDILQKGPKLTSIQKSPLKDDGDGNEWAPEGSGW